MKKPSIRFIQGDLLQALEDKKVDYIAHQCNMISASSSCAGIAGVIFNRYKECAIVNNTNIHIFNAYNRLGKAAVDEKNKIFNVYSQFRPGRPTEGIDSMNCRMSYLEEGLEVIKEYMTALKESRILGIPLIASGLAKQIGTDLSDLDYFKKFIFPLVKKVFKNSSITIKIYYL